MPNTNLIIDIADLFASTFGRKPYVVPGIQQNNTTESDPYKIATTRTRAEQEFTAKGSILKEQFRGVEVMLPIRFFDNGSLLMGIPYCVISVGGSKNIIETELSERIGSVKEQFNISDYVFNIKGFLISEDRKFPEVEIETLRALNETSRAVTMDNALSNIFLSFPGLRLHEQRRVVIYNFQLVEVQGGREHVRPFTMMAKSDTVFTLELQENIT